MISPPPPSHRIPLLILSSLTWLPTLPKSASSCLRAPDTSTSQPAKCQPFPKFLLSPPPACEFFSEMLGVVLNHLLLCAWLGPIWVCVNSPRRAGLRALSAPSRGRARTRAQLRGAAPARGGSGRLLGSLRHGLWMSLTGYGLGLPGHHQVAKPQSSPARADGGKTTQRPGPSPSSSLQKGRPWCLRPRDIKQGRAWPTPSQPTPPRLPRANPPPTQGASGSVCRACSGRKTKKHTREDARNPGRP